MSQERNSEELETVHCRHGDAECECIYNILHMHGVRFPFGFWTGVTFETHIDAEHMLLIIDAYHDVGLSSIEIPLNVLRSDIANELLKCKGSQ